jgi:hypothetical protein
MEPNRSTTGSVITEIEYSIAISSPGLGATNGGRMLAAHGCGFMLPDNPHPDPVCDMAHHTRLEVRGCTLKLPLRCANSAFLKVRFETERERGALKREPATAKWTIGQRSGHVPCIAASPFPAPAKFETIPTGCTVRASPKRAIEHSPKAAWCKPPQ